MPKLEIKGLDKLEKALRDNATLSDVKRVVRQNGSQMQKQMKTNADFAKGYQTGATKRSIGLEIKDGGFTAEVAPTEDHAPYLEYGTRFMGAQPFVKPAYNSQKIKFKRDLNKLMR